MPPRKIVLRNIQEAFSVAFKITTPNTLIRREALAQASIDTHACP